MVLPVTTAVYLGAVPNSPKYPYVLVVSNFRAPDERSQARTPQSYSFGARVTVAGLTVSSVRTACAQVEACLEGARLEVEGWLCGRVEYVPNDQPILEDKDVTDTATSRHPLYRVLDWHMTASRT